ncbi:hypothetical protein D3C78_1736470 [compost metagenome]
MCRQAQQLFRIILGQRLSVSHDGGNHQMLLQIAQRLDGKQFQRQPATLTTQWLQSTNSCAIGGIVEYQPDCGLFIERTTLSLVDHPGS